MRHVPPALIRAELARRRTPAGGRPAWTPLPGPQSLGFDSPADVLGYGGAAGGGKTDLIAGLALLRHRRAIVFRREYPQLRAVVERLKEILDGAADPGRFNSNSLTWRFADGRALELGAVQHPDDWRKYRGRPHDLIAVDEATEFREAQVRGLMGWLRTTDPRQRCRLLLTFNPPTDAEGRWVVRWFAPWLDPAHPRPAAPGELRWYARVGGEEVERPDGTPFDQDGHAIRPMSRTFIPARLEDNPHLLATDYGTVLESLPEPLRSQLRRGDFAAGQEDDPWQLIPAAWVDAAMVRWHPAGAGQPLSCLGVDVAHGGADKTVVSPRRGTWFGPLLKLAGRDTPDGNTAAAHVARLLEPGAHANVDAIGYGASAAERLKDAPPAGHGLPAIAVNVAERSEYRDRSGKFRMVNVRAEMYWRLRELLDPAATAPAALPPDDELRADLTAPRYQITTTGIRIEPKDEIRARLGRSPDCGDAMALATLPTPSPPARAVRIPSFTAGYRG